MSCLKRAITAAVLLVLVVAGGPLQAEDQGQDDLDAALDMKLTASALDDLTEVIRLCESALEKGLGQQNTKFAEDLLAATLVQRGKVRAEVVFRVPRATSDIAKLRNEALADLEKGLQLSPDNPEVLFEVARLNLLPGGDTGRAAKALDQVIELATEEPALRAKAFILRAGLQKDLSKKLADMDEAIRLAPGNPAALRTRGVLRGQQGKLDEALRDFDEALKLDPRHAPTYEIKASILGLMGKYDEALICLDKASELRPDSVQPLLEKARIHVAQKNLEGALIVLDQAHSIKPDDVSVLLLRAGIHQERGNHELALADADEALRLKPKAATVMRSRAMVLAGADRFEEAIAQLEKSLELDPKNVATRLQLGMFYNSRKQFAKALEAYSSVLTEHPDNWMALRGRGDVLLNLGRHEEAIADYEKAVKLRPEDSGILNNLAWVLATSPVDELRDGKRAIELATKACELTEYKQAHILSTLAAAYAETGDFDTAIKWSQKGVEIGSEDQREPLSKELESYRTGKPWRELLSEHEQ